jgi:hypothetical protein
MLFPEFKKLSVAKIKMFFQSEEVQSNLVIANSMGPEEYVMIT